MKDQITLKRFLQIDGLATLRSSVCSFMSSIPAPRSSFLSRHWYATPSLLLSLASFAFLTELGRLESFKIRIGKRFELKDSLLVLSLTCMTLNLISHSGDSRMGVNLSLHISGGIGDFFVFGLK